MTKSEPTMWHFYTFGGQAIFPTAARTEAGFYMDIEPVLVVPLSDEASFEPAFVQTLERGNPSVPTPSREEYGKPVVLKHLGLRSWRSFEKRASVWAIHREADRSFTIEPSVRLPRGGWERDGRRAYRLPAETSLADIARRALQLVRHDAALQPEQPARIS